MQVDDKSLHMSIIVMPGTWLNCFGMLHMVGFFVEQKRHFLESSWKSMVTQNLNSLPEDLCLQEGSLFHAFPRLTRLTFLLPDHPPLVGEKLARSRRRPVLTFSRREGQLQRCATGPS